MKDKNGKVLTNHQIISKVANRFNTVALEFWLMVLRFVGHLPFHSVRQIFYIASGLKMPFLRSHIHMWANFFNPANITIGTGTIIGDHCFLDGRDLLIIGNHVNIASQVLIYNDEHDINSPGFGNSFGGRG